MAPPSCIKRPRKNSGIPKCVRRGADALIRPAPQMLVTSFFQCKTDFQGYLPIADFTVIDVSSGLGYFKPSHVANRFFGAPQCILHSLFESIRRRTNYFNFFVNMIGHESLSPEETLAQTK